MPALSVRVSATVHISILSNFLSEHPNPKIQPPTRMPSQGIIERHRSYSDTQHTRPLGRYTDPSPPSWRPFQNGGGPCGTQNHEVAYSVTRWLTRAHEKCPAPGLKWLLYEKASFSPRPSNTTRVYGSLAARLWKWKPKPA